MWSNVRNRQIVMYRTECKHRITAERYLSTVPTCKHTYQLKNDQQFFFFYKEGKSSKDTLARWYVGSVGFTCGTGAYRLENPSSWFDPKVLEPKNEK